MKAGTALEELYYSKNLFVRWYVWHRLKKAVLMAGLQGNETVLDFGCHMSALKKVLPINCKYVGYDIDPVFNTIQEYSTLKNIDIAFALSVFEHLTLKELSVVLKNFRKMEIKKIVIELPRDNELINKAVSSILNLEFEKVLNHKIDWKTAIKEINNFYFCTKVCKHIFISWISVWEKREK